MQQNYHISGEIPRFIVILSIIILIGTAVSNQGFADTRISTGNNVSTCRESDGGNDIFNRSVTKGLDRNSGKIIAKADFCSAGKLTEYYCNDSYVESQIYGPGEGCGKCTAGYCTVCGNGIRERGERCDDGNTIDGDGCSSTCKRENLCGNGKCDYGETKTSCPSDCLYDNKWVVVLTYDEKKLPNDAVNFLCNDTVNSLVGWLDREYSKYNNTRDFQSIQCINKQYAIPTSLINYQQITPLNIYGVIKYLETKVKGLESSKYATVIFYAPRDFYFQNQDVDSKYDFDFIKTPNQFIKYYPELTTDMYGEILAHEYMHKLGASDKYNPTGSSACLIDPDTGEEYDGYDIMCHRIATGAGSYVQPPFAELKITPPTAREIGLID